MNLSPDTNHPLYSRFRTARICTLACYMALLLLITGLNVIRPDGSVLHWLVQALPLLIVMPGMLYNHYRSYSWLCFVILIYFTAYVVEVLSPLYIWTDAIALALSVGIFVSAMMTSRWLQRLQIAAQEQPAAQSSD